MNEARYVIRPEDAKRDWKVAKNSIAAIKEAAKAVLQGETWEVLIRPWSPGRTDSQRATFWMWHGEVAATLTIRTGMRWTKDDVHEIVFLPKFMPQREVVDVDTGEVRSRPLRTGEATKAQVGEAMTKYLAWIFEHGIEVTVPEETW